MKKIITILTLALFAVASIAAEKSNGVKYDWTITRVVDGDTVEIDATWLPDPLKKKLSVRVYGVDTPEKSFRAKCPAEAERGAAATEFTKKILKSSKTSSIILLDWDKYGGRVLGDVIVDGQSLRSLLIANGFAREYYGEAKQSWCN